MSIHVYGLTGKTGAGKSTAARLLSNRGFYIIDGDVCAKKVTEKGSPVLKRLAEVFFDDIILEDGNLDRKKLARRAFSSRESTQKLNLITHGAIDGLFKAEIQKAEKAGYEKCIIDAAALLESPSKKLCEKIIVVTAPKNIRLERILKRDGITKEDAERRINAQKSDEYYFERADIIIRNFLPYNLEEEILQVV